MKRYTHIFGQHKTGCKKPSRGFSLIELLVSVALFTVVITASVGTLLALVAANQKAQSLKSVINNLNFGLESMSRTIRTGREYYCDDSIPNTLPTTRTQDCPNGASGLVLTDDHGKRLAYRFFNNRIERMDEDSSSSWIALSAPEVVIEEMLFYVTGSTEGDDTQPTVTISIRGRSGVKAETDSSFQLQTTVIQRVLDE